MDNTAPFSRPQAPTTPTVSPTPVFTSIKTLFSQSWDRVQKHLLQLFLLDLITFVPLFIIIITLILISVGSGLLSKELNNSVYGTAGDILILVDLVVLFIVIVSGFLALQISTIVLLSQNQLNISLTQIFKASFKKVLPLLALSLLTTLIVIGGLMVFILPGILFGLMLALAPYYLILDNVSPIEAMRKSVYVSSKMFGVLFTRMLALIGVSIMAGILFNILKAGAGSSLSILVSLASFIFNIVFSWVSTAYVLMIFQNGKRNFGDGKGRLSWMVIVAAIGWVMIVAGGYFVYRAIPATPTTLNPLPIPALSSPLPLPSLSASPSARLASPSPTVKPTIKSTATPKPSTASPSATAK